MKWLTIGAVILATICGTQQEKEEFWERGIYEFKADSEYYTKMGKIERILYDNCHNATAINVKAPLKRHLDRWDKMLKVEVMSIHKWGFTARIYYVGKKINIKSTESGFLALYWRALFASKRDFETPCPNAWRCLNGFQEQVCSCYEHYWGKRCENVSE